MQKKAAVLLVIGTVSLACIAWLGLTIRNEINNEPGTRVNGPALSIDVIAPREPEPVRSSGQLSVGELNNGYDHAATMAQAEPSQEDANGYTSWNDDNWSNEGVLPDETDKRIYQSNPQEKPATITVKVPEGDF